MKNFIELSFREKSFKKMLINIELIDYVLEDLDDSLGSHVYLRGKQEPLHVSESVSSITRKLSDFRKELFPQEQTQPIHLQHSLFRKK